MRERDQANEAPGGNKAVGGFTYSDILSLALCG